MGGAETWEVAPHTAPTPHELHASEPQSFTCEKGSRTDPASLGRGFEPRGKVRSRELGRGSGDILGVTVEVFHTMVRLKAWPGWGSVL